MANPHHAGTYNSPGAGRRPLILVLLIGAALAAMAGSARAADPVVRYPLPHGVELQLLPGGAIVLCPAGEPQEPLLELVWPLPAPRRQPLDQTHVAVCAEGEPGGLRGFAQNADDDGDRRLDEDPLDGQDNDGDGQTDEDYAAISDLMGVLDLRRAGHHLHMETYHWDYPHLRSTVMISCAVESNEGGERAEPLRLQLGQGRWDQAVLPWVSRPHSDETPREALLLVVVAERPDVPGGRLWIGVTPLDKDPGLRNEQARIRLHGDSGEIPALDGRLEVAVGAAPSLLQLQSALAGAHAVRRGALSSRDGREIPWIVPPLCPSCRQTAGPSARWRDLGAAGWALEFEVVAGENAILDPDLFRVDGHYLGSPVAVTWLPAGAKKAQTVDWQSPATMALAGRNISQLDPYRDWPQLRDHSASGVLGFRFGGALPAALAAGGAELGSDRLSGSGFMQVLAAPLSLPAGADFSPAKPVGPGKTPAGVLKKDLQKERVPSLAPDLLMNYPNPFRDYIHIEIRVPRTLAEGFVWDEGEQPPVDLQAAIPYAGGRPTTSLRIYNISGQEVATLFDGSLPPGSGQCCTWDGQDAFGRPVASGAYFCKLQIEDWAVTKQVVILR